MARVTAPDGRVWKVGRRWLPDRPRLRSRSDADPSALFDGLGSDFDDAGIGLVIGAVVLVLALLLLVLFPLVAIAVELVLVLVLAIAGLIGRFVFRHPWHVVARTDGRQLEWPVQGWRESGEKVREVADAIRAGVSLNP